MAGFDNNVMYADNVDFTGSTNPSAQMTANGQLIIGKTGSNPQINTLTAGTGITITNGAGTITIANNGANDLHTARFIVSSSGTNGTGANYTTISAAIAAAQGTGVNSTVFIQPGTYTENLTLVSGVNLAAYSCDGATPNVTIVGKLTATFAGSCSISGIRLKTNSDFCLSVTGASATVIKLVSCYVEASNNTAIQFTSASASSLIWLEQCHGDLDTTGIGYFTHSGAGVIKFVNGLMENNGGSSTASTVSGAGAVNLYSSFFAPPITTSSTSGFIALNSQFSATLTIGGSGTNQIINSSVATGANSGISVGGTLTISSSTVDSSNTNAITGAGTLQFADLSFSNTSSGINTTTQTPRHWVSGAFQAVNPAGDYTVLQSDYIVGATTSAARAITLPAAPVIGEVHIVKDITGTANTHNITVSGNGKNIDGAASYVMSANYSSATFYYNGTNWFVI